VKRILIVAGIVGLFLNVAVADARVVGPQKETGQVVLPTPHPQDPNVCFQGVARRINMISQGVYNGPFFGAIFDVDKATWNGKLKLTITEDSGHAEDLDIYLFANFGQAPPDDPAYNSPVILATYQERKAGGEVGLIPEGTTKAIVCLWTGVYADFSYVGKPPK
jgi:hypothetical protein